jgi:hypothetical protein
MLLDGEDPSANDTDESEDGMLNTLAASCTLVLLYKEGSLPWLWLWPWLWWQLPSLPPGFPAQPWSVAFLLTAIDLRVSAMPATADSRLVLSRSTAAACKVAIFLSIQSSFKLTRGVSCVGDGERADGVNEIPEEISGEVVAELNPAAWRSAHTLLGVPADAGPLDDALDALDALDAMDVSVAHVS